MNWPKPAAGLLETICIVLLTLSAAHAQTGFKVFLVGDAGDHTEPGTTLRNLEAELMKNPNSAVIFLGDNSYKNILWGIIPYGFKGFDSTQNTMDKVRSQLGILNNYYGSAFFTPGNHDWWNRTTYKKGKAKLAMEESFIEENLKGNTHIANPENVFLPKHGNYGPDYVELNNHTLRIIFIDTYRIIQTGIKKNKIPEEEKLFYTKLDSTISQGYQLNQKVMVVAHHPVHAIGPINNPPKNPYFQARIKASLINFPSYKSMTTQMIKVLQRYPGIYYASGHVHALQYYFTPDSIHYIISGSGSKEHKMAEWDILKYEADEKPGDFLLWNSGGFFEIEFKGDTTHTVLYYDDASKKCTIP
jgi:hypothetical protein